MIIPMGAPLAYVSALREAYDKFTSVPRTDEQLDGFYAGFRFGWEKSKDATFKILEQITEGN